MAMFEKMVLKYVNFESPLSHKWCLPEISNMMNISCLKEIDKRFAHHPHDWYATDVMIDQSNRLRGNMMEANPCLIATQKLHDSKTEACDLSNKIFIGDLHRKKGGNSNVCIFRFRLFTLKCLKKKADDGESVTN